MLLVREQSFTIFAVQPEIALRTMAFILLYAFAAVHAFLLANTWKRESYRK